MAPVSKFYRNVHIAMIGALLLLAVGVQASADMRPEMPQFAAPEAGSARSGG